MDLRARLSLPEWDALADDAKQAAAREVQALVPRAKFRQLENVRQGKLERKVAVFDVDGAEMSLIPGGEIVLGFEPGQLDSTANVAWSRSFQEAGHVAQQVVGGPDVGRAPPPDDMLRYVKSSLSPRRSVKLAPFLLERSLAQEEDDANESNGDPHLAKVERVRSAGFRIPNADEWEHACSGGARTLFRWGNTWPVDTDVYEGGDFVDHQKPNAFGLCFGTSPYESEIVADPEQLHAGDGGSLVCGNSGPIAWITFASAYRYRLGLDDDREIWFEQAHFRRALSIFPTPDEDIVLSYRPASVLDNPDLAILRIREALSEYDGFVLEGKERDEFAAMIPDLEAVAAAHPSHASVQASCARALRKLGRLDEAEGVARRALAIEKTFDTLTALAAAHRARGEIAEALVLLDETALVDPTDASSSLEAGDLLAEQGRYREAAARFERALQREPSSGYAEVKAHYTRFKTSRDPAEVKALGKIAKGPAKGATWVRDLYEEIKAESAGTRKKPPATKKKRSTTNKSSSRKKSSRKKSSRKKSSRKKSSRKKSSRKKPSRKKSSRKKSSRKKPSRKKPSAKKKRSSKKSSAKKKKSRAARKKARARRHR